MFTIKNPDAAKAYYGEQAGSSIGNSIDSLMQMKLQVLGDRYKRAQEMQQRRQMVQGYSPEAQQALMPFANKPETLLKALQTMQYSGQQSGNQDPMANMYANTGAAGNPAAAGLASRIASPSQQGGYNPPMMPGNISNQGNVPQYQNQMGQSSNIANKAGISFQKPMTQAQFLANQRKIETSNKSFRTEVQKSVMGDAELIRKAREAIELIKGGQTRSGAAGLFPLGLTMANTETRELDSLLNEIALTRAGQGSGVLSKARIVAAQKTKASLDMPKKAQIRILERAIKQAEERGLALGDIEEEILKENDWVEPPNLQEKVMSRYKERYPHLFAGYKGGEKKKQLIEPNQQIPEKEKNLQDQDGSAVGNYMDQPSLGTSLFNAIGSSPEKENALGWGIRQGVTAASNIAGDIATTIPTLAQAGLGLLNYGANAVGLKTPTYSEIPVLNQIPTSSSLEKSIQDFTGGYTKPRTTFEQGLQDGIRAVGSIVAPNRLVGAAGKGLQWMGIAAEDADKATKYLLPFSGIKTSIPKAIGMVTAGKFAKGATEALGAGPVIQSGSQLIAMILAGQAGNRKALINQSKLLYDEAAEGFGRTSLANTERLEKTMDRMDKQAIVTADPHQAGAWKEISDSVKKAQAVTGEAVPGRMRVADVVKMRQNLSQRYGWTSTERQTGMKEYTPEGVKKTLHDVISELDRIIGRSSEMFPEAGAKYVAAADITKGLKFQGSVQRWFADHSYASPHFKSNFIKHLFGMTAGGGTMIGINSIAKTYDLLSKSAVARNYYKQMMNAAAQGSSREVMSTLTKLDKLFLDQEKQED